MRLLGSLALLSLAASLWIAKSHVEAREGDPPRMRTIGVLGGIGPQATMDFEARLHRAAQGRIPARANGGYPPMVVYYHRRPPIVLKEGGAPYVPLRPDPEFLEAARKLGAMTDFLVVVANGPHGIQAEIEAASGRKVLSMIDVTLEEVRRRGWTKVGVLGMGDPFVITRPLEALQIEHEILEADARDRLDVEILRVMEGRDDEGSRRLGEEAVETLRARGVDGVILGCTELPILLPLLADAPDIINPAELLAEAAVRLALE
jgi:aspartate racemase